MPNKESGGTKMKAIKLALIIGLVALLVLAGCSSSAQKNYSPPSGQRYVGGGCGVQAPAQDVSVAEAVAAQPAQAA
ncbi:hypothetical protein HY485_03505 [Candidatus Woesearchaeota archaeon]|nr:hypothetical protein [Candidatus Woesearchaeota archaeon]